MSVYKLKELGSFKNGANYPKGSYGEGLPIVNVKDLFTPRYVDLTKLVELKKGALKNEDDYLVENDDILFSRSSLVQSGAGMCAIAHNIIKKTLFCGFIIRYRIVRRDILNPLYLLYLLRTPTYRRLFTGTQQTNIANINHDTLGNIEIDLPDIETQNSIVAVLKSIDDKRDNNTFTCTDLESMAKLLYDYWFVQFDFPDENGRPYKSSGGKMVWNEELKREIPEGWEAGTFGDVLSALECGDRPSGGAEQSGIPSIGAENIIGIGQYDYSSEKYVSEEYYRKMKSGVVNSWDVLLYKDGAGVGQASMFGDGFPYEECAINSHAFIIRSDDNLYQDYLYLTLCQEYIKKIVVSLAMKAAQPGLNQPAVKSIPIVLPSKSILEVFNEKVDIMFHKIFACANESRQLASLRDFLLPMLMNGQVKVGKE